MLVEVRQSMDLPDAMKISARAICPEGATARSPFGAEDKNEGRTASKSMAILLQK
jgi:hypothetical protein